MDSPWIAALLALFVWWFSTGAILVVVKRADLAGGSAHLTAVLAGLPLLGLGWYGLVGTMGAANVANVYGAFLSALAIWGWFELAFLCGIITGPNVRPCPPDIPRWERFLRAWGTIAHSEMALIATAVVMVALCWEAPNPFGLWTFLVLFFARISAKLNVYLGVPNINVEFLPAPVRHLASHFRIAPMNAFFPVAVTALSFAAACWLERGLGSPAGSGPQVGFALLAALTGLALLEHWMMVLPLQDAKLWRWMMPRPDRRPNRQLPETRAYLSEDAHGLR
jgi:putative photosynthetic complex assembly protein 2